MTKQSFCCRYRRWFAKSPGVFARCWLLIFLCSCLLSVVPKLCFSAISSHSEPQAEPNTLADAYDFEDRLLSRASDQTGAVASLVYNGDGARVAEIIGGATKWFLVDENNPTGYAQVVEERDAATGDVDRVYTYGLDLVAEHVIPGPNAPPSATRYFGSDGLGTTRLLTDDTGAVTDRFWYDAFGTLLRRTGTFDTRYLYTGEQYDPALGMIYLRARYLRPDLGRFWTRDKWEPSKPFLAHDYVFADAQPTGKIDPLGESSIFVNFSLARIQKYYKNSRSAREAFKRFQKVKTTLCKWTSKAGPHMHHALPIFLGGAKKQNRLELDANFHRQFHQLLHYMLRFNGLPGGNVSRRKYEELFASDPKSREHAHKILLKTAKIMDKSCRGKKGYRPIERKIREQIKEGKWDF